MRRSWMVSIAVVFALAACGNGTKVATSKVSTLEVVAAAPAAAVAQKTARLEGEMKMSTPDGDVTISMSGAADFVTNRVALSMDMSDVPGLGGNGTFEMRLVDGTMYMNMGGLAGALPGGKQWIATDLRDFGGSESQLTGQNPADMLANLRGAGDVQDLGTATVNGVETHHYRAEVDLAKAMDKVAPKYRDQAKRSIKLLGTTFPMDVWIDNDGLPRRMGLELHVRKIDMRERVDFTDYGEPVDVQAPPADQTMSLDALNALNAD